jgi:hypothetical protein
LGLQHHLPVGGLLCSAWTHDQRPLPLQAYGDEGLAIDHFNISWLKFWNSQLLKTLDLEEIIVYAGRFHKFNVEEPEEYRWIDLQDVKGLEDPRFSKYKSEVSKRV